ncbi:hypothetical protein [Aureispira sp. CCB-QB1]|uniref:leucine-rich repeat domain-containing protein n=1 Tax=Aureispira sp. CCB-QB1 TaxID=1313421 RepID=UPI0006964284|nr:hypothetical protein [Aureispira sp. CCB-QB1]
MKQLITIISVFIIQIGYSQDCVSDIPYEPCSWEFNACYYKEKMPSYKHQKVVDISNFLFIEDCAACCSTDFQLDTIASNFVQDLPEIEVLKLPLVSQFPKHVNALKSLKKVVQYPFESLTSNQYFYTELPSIPTALWNTKTLEELTIYTTQLPVEIQQLNRLRYLELHLENHRSSKAVLPISTTWKGLTNLEKVRLYATTLNTKDIESLSGLSGLTSFGLSTNHKVDHFVDACLEALRSNSSTLQELFLTTNTYRYQTFYRPHLRGKTLSIDAEKEWHNEEEKSILTTTIFPQLTQLSLKDCSLSNFAFNSTYLPQLQILDLSLNRLSNIKIEAGEAAILKQLNLSYNYLTTLPNSIAKLIHLEELDLRGNPILGLPKGIEKMPSLKRVLVDDRTSLSAIIALKEQLGEKLIESKTKLYDNQGTGWMSDHFLELKNSLKRDFSNQKWDNKLPLKEFEWVESISLAKNNLEKIPQQVFISENLKYLDLSDNQLKGKLPVKVAQLRELKGLVLAKNYLQKLPCSIEKIKHLKRLDLSFNCLINLPTTIAKLSNLEYLSLVQNPIQTLPKEIQNLKQIKEIRISRDLPDGLKKQLQQWFGKERVVVVTDAPVLIGTPDME